jgi:hypothetical protein
MYYLVKELVIRKSYSYKYKTRQLVGFLYFMGIVKLIEPFFINLDFSTQAS